MMPVAVTPDVYQDDVAMLLAQVMAVANKQARELGVEASQSTISITQRVIENDSIWRVSYGPRDYIGRRGGDLIIDVDPINIGIRRVLRGQ